MSLLKWLKKLDRPSATGREASLDSEPGTDEVDACASEREEEANLDVQLVSGRKQGNQDSDQGEAIAAVDQPQAPFQGDRHSAIPQSPHQPHAYKYPMQMFGNQQRAFCPFWYSKYSWLHYQESNDSVLCFHCLVADPRKQPEISLNKDYVFCKNGFSNWKKALERFEKHLLLSGASKEMMNTSKHSEWKQNREMLYTIFTSIRFLVRQGLALRGSYKGSEAADKLSEHAYNFIQLLNPLTVGINSTYPLIITKNSFLQLLYAHTLTNRYQVEAHTFNNKMAVVRLL